MAHNRKQKNRSAANTAESATLSTNEKILQDCYKLYTDEEKGLVKLGAGVGLTLSAPREKVTVLLIGNHSAGKSSFINWYIEEHVQRTSVAIETQGFTLVTSGKKRESYTGMTTFHVFPFIKDLQEIDGVVDYLTTEVSSSKQRKFSLVTFIDSPGLVDGDMKYPFDVNEAIVQLGDIADLIVVLFDPLGQALCKRTLNILEELSRNNSGKLRLYLSKADTAGVQKDRQRVLIQITQEISRRPGLNKAGFDMPTIYIPTLTAKNVPCDNQIEELCTDIEKTINRTIQNTLNNLEKDAQQIEDRINNKLKQDRAQSQANLSSKFRGILLFVSGILLFFSIFVPVVDKIFTATLGNLYMDTYMAPFFLLWHLCPADYHMIMSASFVVLAATQFFFGKRMFRTMATLSGSKRRQLREQVDYINSTVKERKSLMYKDYLKQSVELA